MAGRKWTHDENDFLLKHYEKDGLDVCVNALQRTKPSIYQQAEKLGLSREHHYTQEELEKIKAEYEIKGAKKLAEEIGVSRTAMRDMSVRLGVNVGRDFRSKQARKAQASRTKEGKKRQSDALRKRRGPKNNLWRGGVCNINEMVRGRLYSVWAKFILERDDYTCQLCGERGGKLDIHHVRTFTQIRDAVIDKHPELNLGEYEDREKLADLIIDAHELKDGVTLCRACHKKHHLENGVNCGKLLTGGAEDNPQPSRSNVLDFVGRKVQRLMGEDAQADKPNTNAPATESYGCMR